MRSLTLSSGQAIPVLGMGTWRMGERPSARSQEVAALRHGLDMGFSLIDTAEMYGEGGAEEVVGEAIAGRRAEVVLVSKVYPHNASKKGAIAACERSLKRLKTDYLDLFLLHWPGSYPLAETLGAFRVLKQAGKIRDFGVSNFDVGEMTAWLGAEAGDAQGTSDTQASTEPKALAHEVAVNQVLYNLSRRGVEYDLLPWCRSQQIPVMAYSPIEQGRLLNHGALRAIALEKGVSVAQVAIAWVLHSGNVVAIPKAGTLAHVEENYAALGVTLSKAELAALDKAFPPPTQPVPLQVL